jgi:hypothetical protein
MPSRNPSKKRSASERTIRNLANLQANASTARAFNLIAAWEKSGLQDEYRTRPFFTNPALNRSIIVKHRLRSDELESFHDFRTTATKVLLPFDVSNLRVGARSFFVGQRGYRQILADLFEESGIGDEADIDLLDLLDRMPSLDPFLMREHLRRNGVRPARLYFDISPADNARIFQFAKRELAPLIGLTMADSDNDTVDKSAILAKKILTNDNDAGLEPLRIGMGLDRATFEEGIFCWKGFIYYKWMLNDLAPAIRPVSQEIGRLQSTERLDADDVIYLNETKARLATRLAVACETVRLTLKVYDDAFDDLTRNGLPRAFREFLLKAPQLFQELGERLGAVQHVISFWRYRFPEGARTKMPTAELMDLLADFEQSLNFDRLGEQGPTADRRSA